jgi:hypothetical protein
MQLIVADAGAKERLTMSPRGSSKINAVANNSGVLAAW